MSWKKALFLLCLASAAALKAQMPNTFLFEARLTDPATGTPMTGTRNMRFTVYNAPTGGDALSAPEDRSVTLHEGWFHILLKCSYPYWVNERYVGICLLPNLIEMSPRIAVIPTPSSYLSGRVISSFGVSKFYRDAGIQMSDSPVGYDPENQPEAKLSIYTEQWGGPTLIGLRAAFGGTLIKGSVTEGTGVDIETNGGIALVGRSSSGTGHPGEPDTFKPGIGVKGEGKDYGGYFVGSINTSPGTNRGTGGYFEGNQYAGLFKGRVHARGDYTREYGSGDETRAMPIAYGNVRYDGKLESGTPNLSTSWDEVNRRYLIVIANESVTSSGTVTVVTPIRTKIPPAAEPLKPVVSETSAANGKLVVKFYNAAGRDVRHNFQFVTYKP
jgi:hypothetical protein